MNPGEQVRGKLFHNYTIPNPIRDVTGYLSKSGRKVEYLCPWCGWMHTADADNLFMKPPCRPYQSRDRVKIIKLEQAPFPVHKIADEQNRRIAAAEAAKKED